MAEMDRRTSPYAYGFDDPIRHTDPDGMFGEDVNDDEDGPGPRTIVSGAAWGAAGASGILAGGLALGGGIAAGGTVTVVGAPFAWAAGAVVVTGAAIGAGTAYLWDKFHENEPNSSIVQSKSSKSSNTNNDREGKDFTRKGKKEVIEANKEKNEGKTVCEGCKVKTTKPEQSKLGVTPPKTDTQVDHVIPKAKKGKGIPSNGQVLCRNCNIKKSDKVPTPQSPI